MDPDRPFKKCSMCGTVWRDREEFLNDRDVRTAGYMPHFEQLELGLFLFNHESCRTTLAVKAALFTDLPASPLFTYRLTGTEQCPQYCLRKTDLRPCPASCECAYVREVLNKVANWTSR